MRRAPRASKATHLYTILHLRTYSLYANLYVTSPPTLPIGTAHQGRLFRYMPTPQPDKKPYTKPALTHQEQLDLLISRGLSISDTSLAIDLLGHINYYRLRSYSIVFEANSELHTFKPNTTLDDVQRLYNFDRELRIHIMVAMEVIEVSLRTKLAYNLSHAAGPHAHLDKQHFTNTIRHKELIDVLIEDTKRGSEVFVEHFKNEYLEILPPLWAVVEIMTFGQISHLYNNIASNAIKKQIAREYDLSAPVAQSIFHHLTIVRNHCAHHSRLWNRAIAYKAKLPHINTDPLSLSLQRNQHQLAKIYNSLVFISHLHKIIVQGSTWHTDLVELLKKYNIDVRAMGFPDDYEKLPTWLE